MTLNLDLSESAHFLLYADKTTIYMVILDPGAYPRPHHKDSSLTLKVILSGPTNFLLYADMTTINMISLDPGTEVGPIVLHHGDINSNFVALTYDDVKDRVYWSDHTRLD